MMLRGFFQKKKAPHGGVSVLIAGLGNPEKKYENSRHNAGFAVIDALAKDCNATLSKTEKRALTGSCIMGETKALLAKPLTYMNASGEAVRALSDYYRIDTKQSLIVIVDDVNLPVGMIRIREKGSAGGHNGLKNIIRHLGHDQFIRVRVGVGGEGVTGDLIPHVLSPVPAALRNVYNESILTAAFAAKLIVTDSVSAAMNRYNRKGGGET